MLRYRARRGNAAGAFCCASQLERMLFLLPIQLSFFTRTLLCVSTCRATKGGKKLLHQLKETGFLQPKSDRLTDDHAWLLRSVSDPHTQAALVTGRSVDCENGQKQDGGQVERAFPLGLTQTVTPAHLFVCLSEGGWKPGL